MKKIRVLIADDHALLRQGLVRLLELEEHIEVVGQASNGEETLALVKCLEPDIVILDINMPGMNGIETTRHLRAKYSKTRILALTIHEDESYVIEMIRAGVHGYLLKDSEPSWLVRAIERVDKGETFFTASLMKRVMDSYHRIIEENGKYQSAATLEELRLTSREQDVLKCIVDGMSNKEISNCLQISEKTVKNHITSLLRKLDVDDRTQAAVFAVSKGIFQ